MNIQYYFHSDFRQFDEGVKAVGGAEQIIVNQTHHLPFNHLTLTKLDDD